MNYVIDRRLNARHKNAVNRQRFIQRYKKQIKKAVDATISGRNISDMQRGEELSIPKGDISEPSFRQGEGGTKNTIYPGNKTFSKGDKIEKPEASSGQGGAGDASDQGEGEDEFVFRISQDEFLDVMFDDLELPRLVKKNLSNTDAFKMVHAGISESGVPSKLNIIRTMHSAYARRLALSAAARRKLKEVTAILESEFDLSTQERHEQLALQEKLRKKIKNVPFLDEFDLKYNIRTKQPQPSSRAVMFCIMDVSGSMDQSRKDIAKRFFVLLYLFLQRNYEKTELVFIRHHTSAKEVDEDEFFYSRETGGTIVSSALRLTDEIIKTRYPVRDWNIYVAQASDGDNWQDDSPICSKIIREKILPEVNHYAYVEITEAPHQALWDEFETIAENSDERFTLKQVKGPADIYPVFKDLFQRRKA